MSEEDLIKERDSHKRQGNWFYEMSPGQKAIFYILVAGITGYFIFHKGEIDWKWPGAAMLIICILVFKNYDPVQRIYTAEELAPFAWRHAETLKNNRIIPNSLTLQMSGVWLPFSNTIDGETKISAYQFCFLIPYSVPKYLIVKISTLTAFIEKSDIRDDPIKGTDQPDIKHVIGPEVFNLLRGAKKVNQEFGGQQGPGQGGI